MQLQNTDQCGNRQLTGVSKQLHLHRPQQLVCAKWTTSVLQTPRCNITQQNNNDL